MQPTQKGSDVIRPWEQSFPGVHVRWNILPAQSTPAVLRATFSERTSFFSRAGPCEGNRKRPRRNTIIDLKQLPALKKWNKKKIGSRVLCTVWGVRMWQLVASGNSIFLFLRFTTLTNSRQYFTRPRFCRNPRNCQNPLLFFCFAILLWSSSLSLPFSFGSYITWFI